MTRPPEDLLAALGRMPVPTDGVEHASAQRKRVLQHLEQVERRLAEEARTRGRRLRATGAGVAFACGVAAALGLPRVRSMMEPAREVPLKLISGQIETGPQGLRRADVGYEMSLGQKLRTASAGARVGVDRNATLDLAQATEVSFAGGTGRRVVELHRGSVHLTVERLTAGQSLSVRTPDATVTVQGTRFSVSTGGVHGVCTTVLLEQGVVSVDSDERHLLLTAPAKWSSCPATRAPAAVAEARSSPTAEAARSEAAAPALPPPSKHRSAPAPALPTKSNAPGEDAPRATPEPQARAATSSTLGEENALLASAREAALAGNDASAVSQLERLLTHYPRSTLAQNASVERFRSLKRLGRSEEARRAAARYLTDYPDGFARDEARHVLKSNP